MTEPSEDAIDIIVLAQEAMDMMQEVPINNLSSDDTNIVITKLEQIRSYIRRKETIIKFRKTSIRDFIASSYVRKYQINLNQMQIKDKGEATKHSKIILLLECINRDMDNLRAVFGQNIGPAVSSGHGAPTFL